MINYREVGDNNEKMGITRKILYKLPDWFGVEDYIEDYIKDSVNSRIYAAYESEDDPIGFISVKCHNQYSAEVYVMGILPEYHRKGVGTAMIKIVEDYLIQQNYKFLMVKTLSESSNDPWYSMTRKFYCAAGFYPLEEIKEIWGENEPCLIMIKQLEGILSKESLP